MIVPWGHLAKFKLEPFWLTFNLLQNLKVVQNYENKNILQKLLNSDYIYFFLKNIYVLIFLFVTNIEFRKI